MSSHGRQISLSAVKSKLKGKNLMLSSEQAINQLICQFILQRAVGGLAKSLEEVMSVADKKIVKPQHLQLALNSITL